MICNETDSSYSLESNIPQTRLILHMGPPPPHCGSRMVGRMRHQQNLNSTSHLLFPDRAFWAPHSRRFNFHFGKAESYIGERWRRRGEYRGVQRPDEREFIRSFQPKLIPRSHVRLGGRRGGVICARECGRLLRRESSCQTRRERLKLNLEGDIMMSPWLRLSHTFTGAEGV